MRKSTSCTYVASLAFSAANVVPTDVRLRSYQAVKILRPGDAFHLVSSGTQVGTMLVLKLKNVRFVRKLSSSQSLAEIICLL